MGDEETLQGKRHTSKTTRLFHASNSVLQNRTVYLLVTKTNASKCIPSPKGTKLQDSNTFLSLTDFFDS